MIKLVRDPCIIRGGDGKFHMVWTVSWNERGIGYTYSDDLIHWSELMFLKNEIKVPEVEKNIRKEFRPAPGEYSTPSECGAATGAKRSPYARLSTIMDT